MKKILLMSLIMSIMLVASVMAVKPTPAADNGLNDNGKASQLYLFEKNPSDWSIVDDGAWGKMMYKSDSFVFNGHGLEAGEEYTLIRYTDPWPGTPVKCLSNGVSNNGGNLNLAGEILEGGPKVWLVLSDDVDCTTELMTGWNPSEYLFEYNVI